MARGNDWKTQLLVIQGTPFCNLDCSYCYLPNRSDRSRMTISTLRLIFERLFESPFIGNTLTVVWHSGEPLVLPIDFYRSAFDLADALRPPGVSVSHSFQTNGTLISDLWAEFILETGARIGVSVDGPREIHDRHRRTRSGAGSYDRTMAGIKTLQSFGIPFHVITVLTGESMAQPEALYRFYKDNGITRVCFNIEEIEGSHASSSLGDAAAADGFRLFLRNFLAFVKADGPDSLWVREFAGALSAIEHYSGSAIDNPQTTPFAIVSVDSEGNVSTFSPELLGVKSQQFGDFIIGNVHHQSLLEMSGSGSFARMVREINDGVEACGHECAYFKFCAGGAPANKLFENGSFASTETMYCRLCRQAMIDVVLEDMERGLDIRIGRSDDNRQGAVL